MEYRYIKIDSCNKCEFKGISINNGEDKQICFCVNPDNIDAKAIDNFMYHGIYHPLITKTSVNICPIPEWCSLPDVASQSAKPGQASYPVS